LFQLRLRVRRERRREFRPEGERKDVVKRIGVNRYMRNPFYLNLSSG